MKKSSASLDIKEIPMQTTQRLHLTPVRMTIIKKQTTTKVGGCNESGTLIQCV
jgi:hypothetical protein